jgi:hypothetical protein
MASRPSHPIHRSSARVVRMAIATRNDYAEAEVVLLVAVVAATGAVLTAWRTPARPA